MDVVNDAGATVSMLRAAEMLEVSFDVMFDLVFTGRIASVCSPAGRPLVPLAAIDERRAAHPISA